MSTTHPVTPESPIADQIRFLDDFLRGGDSESQPPPEPEQPRLSALLRVRDVLAATRAQVAAATDF
jgi:hypothetical protein